MEELSRTKFLLPTEFTGLLRQCFAMARYRLQLFDPDFSIWSLGGAEATQILRQFLLSNKKSRIEMVMHKTTYIERDCPRFMHLFTEFGHVIECRVTPKNLRHLTDSFCIADDAHIVRRFHSDHFHGEAVFNAQNETQNWQKRFTEIWLESDSGLHAATTGL